MKKRLQKLSNLIEEEIEKNGYLIIDGQKIVNISNSDNCYSGNCVGAIVKLQRLAPDLDIKPISIRFVDSEGTNLIYKLKQHILAEVKTIEGVYHVDPTIKQYLSKAKTVYGPSEIYPIKILSVDYISFRTS